MSRRLWGNWKYPRDDRGHIALDLCLTPSIDRVKVADDEDEDNDERGHGGSEAKRDHSPSIDIDPRATIELFGFTDNKIAVQFWYEWHDEAGQWWRTYGLEDWTFAENGLMRKRHQMSGNDVKISGDERWFKEGVDVNAVDISEAHW